MEKIFREIKESIIFGKRDILDFPAHIHEDIELVFIKKGEGTAYCDGEKYNLYENSFFIVFPNQVHYYEECKKGEYIILIIKSNDLLGYNNIFFEGTPISSLISLSNDDGIINLFEIALKEFQRDGMSTIIKAYLTAIFGKLLKFYEISKNEYNNETLRKILDFCKEHYKDNISLTSVADQLHINRSTVSHIFSSKLCLHFCDYINSLRLTDAINMLKDNNLSITEISYLSGFSTIRTFNRAFIKRYGISPSEFRKSCNL